MTCPFLITRVASTPSIVLSAVWTFDERAGGVGAAGGAVWGFRHIGAGDDGFELKLVVDPSAGPVRITVVDQSPGIDDPAAARLGPDTMYARSWVAGTALVRRSFAF